MSGGLTIVVSPLISLMQDQVEAAQARGIPAACLNSSLGKAERTAARESIANGSLRLLYPGSGWSGSVWLWRHRAFASPSSRWISPIALRSGDTISGPAFEGFRGPAIAWASLRPLP